MKLGRAEVREIRAESRPVRGAWIETARVVVGDASIISIK